MIVLISGASDIGRRMLAEKMAREDEQWRHLPLERVAQLVKMQELQSEDGNEQMFVRIACHCAKQMTDEGFHVVLSHPTGTDEVDIMREELGPRFVAFHLGHVDEDEVDDRVEEVFDYLIDSARHSVNDAYGLIMQVLED
jgi:chorismate mutase